MISKMKKNKKKIQKNPQQITEYNLTFNKDELNQKVMFGIPTTGLIRFEWHAAMSQLCIPTNWSHGAHYVASPVGYQVAEARNDCVRQALEKNFEWMFFIDHDVLLPVDSCIKIRNYMNKGTDPVIGGLYYNKASVPEPLLYRGRGNGPFYGWKPGDVVDVDGLPMGLTMIHTSLFRAMNPPWFVTPMEIKFDEDGIPAKVGGTEDLYFFDRVLSEGILEKAGWSDAAKKQYPFLCDTSIFAQHIDLSTGRQYPRDCDDQWVKNHEWGYARFERVANRNRVSVKKPVKTKLKRALKSA